MSFEGKKESKDAVGSEVVGGVFDGFGGLELVKFVDWNARVKLFQPS